MNNAQRNEYRAAWQRRLKGVEKRWAPKVKTALDHQVSMVVAYVKTEGLYAGKLNLSLIVPYEGLATVLRAMYVNAGLFQANVTWSELKRLEGQKYRGFGFNKEWTEAIIQYFRANILDKVVLQISDNTKDWIRQVLEKATEEGLGVDETVREIMTKAKDINAKRARLITRTESVRAMNYATLLTSEKSSLVLDKQWIDAKDSRERKTHILCGKQKPIEINDTFSNGLHYPGDPDGSAAEVCNCRCSIAMVPRRDEKGNVIRKQKVQPVQNPVTGQQVPVTDLRPKPSVLGQVAEGIATGLMLGDLIADIVNENNE